MFRLTGDPNTVLPRYTGPCGSRPESNNCLNPSIEAINEVVPDAAGIIQIAFPDMSVLNQPHGLLVSTALALPAICPKQIVDGTPDQNFCDSAISDDSVGHSISHGHHGHSSDHGTSSHGGTSSVVLHPAYPRCLRFYSNLPTEFTTARGTWYMNTFDEYNYVNCLATPGELSSQRRMFFSPFSEYNIAYFNEPDYLDNVNLQFVTNARTDTLEDALFGLVLDYRQINGLDNFTAVVLDFKNRRFVVQRKAAGLWLAPAGAANNLNIVRNKWYTIDVRVITSASPGRVDIVASCRDVIAPSTPSSGGVVQVLSMPGFGINTGRYGFISQASNTYFTHLIIDTV